MNIGSHPVLFQKPTQQKPRDFDWSHKMPQFKSLRATAGRYPSRASQILLERHQQFFKCLLVFDLHDAAPFWPIQPGAASRLCAVEERANGYNTVLFERFFHDMRVNCT